MSVTVADIYGSMAIPDLHSKWTGLTKPKERDALLAAIMTRSKREDVFPSKPLAAREAMAGLYPDPADPQFASRLFGKREFHEARAVATGLAEGAIDPCMNRSVEQVFERTPVQRIVSRFMSPTTPYMGLLLFHGVGVGKTCSAVSIAEQFLEAAPTSPVIVLVPQALQDNFKRTVFDPATLTWSASKGQWLARQCTGTSYLERLGLLENPDLRHVMTKVHDDIRKRYMVIGYQAFANQIKTVLAASIPKAITDPEERARRENEILRRRFSDRLIIIDEAHNMRDTAEEADEATETTTAGDADAKGGKELNPFLQRILLFSEGVRLVLMTATPMYNSAPEIVRMLNLLLMNDTKKPEKSLLKASALFNSRGELNEENVDAVRALEQAVRRYVSYMRGENPFTFPLRMSPVNRVEDPVSVWPTVSATTVPVEFTDYEAQALRALPFVFTQPEPGSPPESLLRAATPRGGDDSARDEPLDARIQMANMTYPSLQYGTRGFDSFFTTHTQQAGANKVEVYRPKVQEELDTVFGREGLRIYAPKIRAIVDSVIKSRGISFVFSRYVKAGALPVAIALERAGFQRRLADGSLKTPLLQSQPPVPFICAICGKEQGHERHVLAPVPVTPVPTKMKTAIKQAVKRPHEFVPACYVLLTSKIELSPNFPGLVQQATTWKNPITGPLGGNVKVIIGSQITSEGLDLKCVRELHVLDSWYHLNRIEQIVGRAIRFCSHTALRAVEQEQGLPLMSLNNCLINLHALNIPEFETADLYTYRVAIHKALAIGRVQRLLKTNAWDCQLELEAISFTGIPPRKQIDAHGNERRSVGDAGEELNGYSVNDQDYTSYCDYQVCSHACASAMMPVETIDNSTFTKADARQILLAKQQAVRSLFDTMIAVPEEFVRTLFSSLPWELASDALHELLDGRRFRLTRPDGVEGFLIKKAGFLVFQPSAFTSTDIPLTLRSARALQLRRHVMMPSQPVLKAAEEEEEEVEEVEEEVESAARKPSDTRLAILIRKWTEWRAYVNGAKVPFPLSSEFALWSWILPHFTRVPTVRLVALQWWIDTLSFDDIKLLFMWGGDEDIQRILQPFVFKSAAATYIRIFNPSTFEVEAIDAATGVPAPPNLANAIKDKLQRPLKVPTKTNLIGDMGGMFGFCAPAPKEAGKLVYKSLFLKEIQTMANPRITGAACILVSNRAAHTVRIAHLHEAGAGESFAPLLLTELKPSPPQVGPNPTDIGHLTHKRLCLYMEFLTRLYESVGVNGKHWFLDAVRAVDSKFEPFNPPKETKAKAKAKPKATGK